MASSHIPTEVYQFDSWWYPKNKSFPGSPVTLWEPDPTILPDGFDTPWFDKPTDAAEFAEMQTKELQHGRLAMLAAAGMIVQELQTGATLF